MKLAFIFSLLFSLNAMAEAPSFAPFQKILNAHLTENLKPDGAFETYFDYKAANKNPETKKAIKEQEEILKNYSPEKLKTKEEATAFWINAYNFFMITKILNDGFKDGKLEINSVRDLGSWINKYAAFKEKDFVIGGKKYHLDDMEKGQLLGKEYKEKGWKDARIHFAVNCASVGCPPLLQKIYTPENIDAALDENTRRAFKTPRHLKVDGKTLHLTHLFKWYKGDFEEAAGSAKTFVLKYIDDEKMKEKIQQTDDIEYIEYDWNLNQKENF